MSQPRSNQSNALGTLGADRPCEQCGFNLLGQPIVRESQYNLLIAACPECGCVSPLQSYPTGSNWIRRWRLMIACLWFVILLVGFVYSIVTLINASAELAGDTGVPLAYQLGLAYDNDQIAQGNPSQAVNWGTNQNRYYQWVTLGSDWYSAHGKQILEDSSTWTLLLKPQTCALMLPYLFLAFCFGIICSVLLLGSSRKRAVLAPLSVALVSIVFVIARNAALPSSYQSIEVVRRHAHLSALLLLCLACAPLALLGIALGRSIMRQVIIMIMPPRLRVPFSILWTRDGLELPKP